MSPVDDGGVFHFESTSARLLESFPRPEASQPGSKIVSAINALDADAWSPSRDQSVAVGMRGTDRDARVLARLVEALGRTRAPERGVRAVSGPCPRLRTSSGSPSSQKPATVAQIGLALITTTRRSRAWRVSPSPRGARRGDRERSAPARRASSSSPITSSRRDPCQARLLATLTAGTVRGQCERDPRRSGRLLASLCRPIRGQADPARG